MQCLKRRAPQLSGYLRKFRDDEGGNIAIILGLTIVILMISIGAAVDIARWLNARNQTVAAIDAAVLAGGRTLQMTNGDKDAAQAAAESYYAENVKSRLPVIKGSDTVKFTVSDSPMGVVASGNAYIDTPFLAFASVDKLPLVNIAQSKAQLGMKSGQTEISMMLDVTGSMAGQKLQDLKDSAQKLVDIVTTANNGQTDKTRIAIVPFSEDIRLPTTAALNAARGTGLPACKRVSSSGAVTNTCTTARNTTMYYLSDCVVERTGNDKYTDAAPGANKYVMAHYTTSSTGSGSNKKGVCTVPAGAAVQPLTSDTAVLSSKISGLSASGGTAGQLGTAWAWYTLSPNWNSLWSAENQALPYATAGDKDPIKKVAILMTDGDYNAQYSSHGILANYGYTSSCPQAANGCAAAQALALCSAMKEEGIEVWTVGFAVGQYSLAAQTLKTCASDETKYYNAEDGDELQNAFTDIAVKLTTVYLSK